MERWLKIIGNAITDPDEVAGRFAIDPEPLSKVAKKYPLRITRSYLDLVTKPGDPIWRQCIPDLRELEDDQEADPLCEDRLSPVPGLIHRYPDRVVLLVSSSCAVYCRFCMRKRGVGCASGLSVTNMDQACAYIAANPRIRDVILSGGDPLLLDDEHLSLMLRTIRAIRHVEIIRIASRTPVTLPERITRSFCRMIREFQPVYFTTHFNHPREITAETARACERLVDAGIPVGNQTVLLKGVNDDPAVMKELMQKLLRIRVRPYYIHHMDLVHGTAHFRTSVADGIAVLNNLRGYTSGLAVPHYVIDLPGGKGKVPITSNVTTPKGSSLLLRNYQGEEIVYPDID